MYHRECCDVVPSPNFGYTRCEMTHILARMRGILERRCSLKKTSIGGQAVMEGVMMKNLDRYAVAVRKPDHEIEVMTDEYKSLGSRYAVLGLPIIRGVVNFGESLYIGLKTLSYSSSFYERKRIMSREKWNSFLQKFLEIS